MRQDSGDPANFVKMVREFYDSQGIKDKKVIVFSDSLNIELCIEYKAITEEAGLLPTFGVGTFFTSKWTTSRSRKETIQSCAIAGRYSYGETKN